MTDSAVVTIYVCNAPPIAADDSTSTKHDSTLGGSVTGNDYDPDGDWITAFLASGPSHAASFTLNADGSFDYTPAYHYVGEDSFTDQASDGIAPSTTATVALNVYNNPPVANEDDGYIAASGVALEVSAGSGVSVNDFDPDGDLPLMAALASNPSHGEIHLYDDGSFTYAHRRVCGHRFVYLLCLRRDRPQSDPGHRHDHGLPSRS